MAIISCSECKKEVSDKANACPHCGAPITLTSAAPLSPSLRKYLVSGRYQLIAAVVVVLVAVASSYAYWVRTPTYSLLQVRDAIKNHDYIKFQEYVDVDNVVSKGVDDVIAQILASSAAESQDKSGFAQLGMAIGASLISTMKPQFNVAIKSALQNWVENPSTTVDGTTAASAASSSLLDILKAANETPSHDVHIIDDGSVATVVIPYHDTDLDADLDLKLAIQQVGNHWKIKNIDNLGVILASKLQLQDDRGMVSEAIQLAGGAEVGLAEYFQNNNAWPANLSDVYETANTQPAGKYVDLVNGSAGDNGIYAVFASLQTTVPKEISGRTVELWTTDGGNTWSCGPANSQSNPIEPKYLPKACRDVNAP